MKSRRILAVLAACTAVTFTGCGVVTVVPIGEEASYTGKQEFDSAAESEGDWSSVVADISQKAQDLVELLNGDGITETTAVKGTGKIKEYKVEKISIIKDTDWNCLENTEKNIITLITCVENQPEYRRCIQGRQCD